jgi:hypothetical protein
MLPEERDNACERFVLVPSLAGERAGMVDRAEGRRRPRTRAALQGGPNAVVRSLHGAVVRRCSRREK